MLPVLCTTISTGSKSCQQASSQFDVYNLVSQSAHSRSRRRQLAMSHAILHHVLCARCQLFLQSQNPIEEYSEVPFGNVGELLQSAKMGCQLCGLVSGKLEAEAREADQWEYIVTRSLPITVSVEVSHQKCMTVVSSFTNQDSSSRSMFYLPIDHHS